MGSILKETKQQLGLDAEASGFDPELILHINSVLADFSQLGLGPEAGFSLTTGEEEWENFLQHEKLLNSAKALTYLRIKMLFDSPSLGYLITSYEKQIEKSEWRLNIAVEELKRPPIPESGESVMNPFGRDAEVTVKGGLVSSIDVGGVVQNVVAGVMVVPAGQAITLTYMQVPTWTWA